MPTAPGVLSVPAGPESAVTVLTAGEAANSTFPAKEPARRLRDSQTGEGPWVLTRWGPEGTTQIAPSAE